MANFEFGKKGITFKENSLIPRINAIIQLPYKERYEKLLVMFTNRIAEDIEVIEYVSTILLKGICYKHLHLSLDEFTNAMHNKDAGNELHDRLNDVIMRQNGNLFVFEDIEMVTNALISFINNHI
jgi:hypothetical protein